MAGETTTEYPHGRLWITEFGALDTGDDYDNPLLSVDAMKEYMAQTIPYIEQSTYSDGTPRIDRLLWFSHAINIARGDDFDPADDELGMKPWEVTSLTGVFPTSTASATPVRNGNWYRFQALCKYLGYCGTPAYEPGDCNGDSVVDAGDLTAQTY